MFDTLHELRRRIRSRPAPEVWGVETISTNGVIENADGKAREFYQVGIHSRKLTPEIEFPASNFLPTSVIKNSLGLYFCSPSCEPFCFSFL